MPEAIFLLHNERGTALDTPGVHKTTLVCIVWFPTTLTMTSVHLVLCLAGVTVSVRRCKWSSSWLCEGVADGGSCCGLDRLLLFIVCHMTALCACRANLFQCACPVPDFFDGCEQMHVVDSWSPRHQTYIHTIHLCCRHRPPVCVHGK